MTQNTDVNGIKDIIYKTSLSTKDIDHLITFLNRKKQSVTKKPYEANYNGAAGIVDLFIKGRNNVQQNNKR